MQPRQVADVVDAEERVNRAAHTLVKEDRYLLEYDVNERTITHKFAEHLQREFPKWDVDCEYNRNHDDPKRLNLPRWHDLSSDDLHATTVFPDIIVHHRGSDDNFIVIEVKKSTNPESNNWDTTKLRAFQRELRYEIAIFIRFRTGTPNIGFDPPLVTIRR